MGWKSWLGAAGAVIGGAVAAPFTAGASIPIGISAAGKIIGSSVAADASKKAAKTQVESAHKAIAYQQPYMDAGAQSINRLSTLMGGQGAISGMAGGQGQMVQMRAPDGSVKAVPVSEVAHWQQRGAKVMAGTADASATMRPTAPMANPIDSVKYGMS